MNIKIPPGPRSLCSVISWLLPALAGFTLRLRANTRRETQDRERGSLSVDLSVDLSEDFRVDLSVDLSGTDDPMVSRLQDESWESVERSPVKTSRRSCHDQEDRRKCSEMQVGAQPTATFQCEKRNYEWIKKWLKSQKYLWIYVCMHWRSEHQFSHFKFKPMSPEETKRRKISWVCPLF